MLIYNELKNKPREFLAATGLKLDEFEKLSPAFQTAYEQKYPPDLTQEGKTRQRQIGGGATGALPQSEDKLFFILVYQKTNPLQTMHGLQFGLSQPQAHAWMYPHPICAYRGWVGLGNLSANGHSSGGPWRQLHWVVYRQLAAKYQRPAWGPSPGQNGAAHRAFMASQRPSAL